MIRINAGAFIDAQCVSMCLVQKQRAVVEECIAESRPRIVEQYHRAREAADAHDIQLNAVVLVNMLLVFNFMLKQLSAG